MIELFDSCEGKSSKEKLIEILRPGKAELLLKRIKGNKEVNLTDEDRIALKDILKDSLTIDRLP